MIPQRLPDDRVRVKPLAYGRALLESGLPAITARICHAVQVYASTGEGHAYMSQKTLASKTGLGERTVRQHLADAERLGFIHRERNYDAPSDTWITCPVGLLTTARIGPRDTLDGP